MRVCVYIYVYIYKYYVCMYVCMYICNIIYVYIYIQIYSTHTHTHTHTHTNTLDRKPSHTHTMRRRIHASCEEEDTCLPIVLQLCESHSYYATQVKEYTCVSDEEEDTCTVSNRVTLILCNPSKSLRRICFPKKLIMFAFWYFKN